MSEQFDFFRQLPVLHTERLALRSVQPDDAAEIFSFTSRPETSAIVSWHPHASVEVTRGFVESIVAKYARGEPAQWAMTQRGSGRVIGIVGFVSFSSVHRRGEIAFVNDPAFWGRGLMTEAVRAVVEYGLGELQLVRVEAKCEVENFASAKVLERAGMSLEGLARKLLFRKGQHRDYKLFAAIAD